MPTVTYEVTATVRADVAPRWESYLREKHIRDVLATGLFARAALERCPPNRYRVRYLAHSREDLDRYLTRHAERLRGDVAVHFPDGISFVRAEWRPVEEFTVGSGEYKL